ncbi:MAG: site-2 protease family protein [Candidatus Woesearchaeota archaeon]
MISFDIISLIVFVILLTILLYKNRKKAELQKVIFPLLYLVLFRSKFGLKFINKVAEKYKELIKFLGYCFIGISFAGLLFISYSMIAIMVKFFLAPKVTETGMQVVLPGSTITGIGYLSFWHWLISLLILVVVHEFSHAVVAKAHGVNVKSSGTAVLGLIVPIFPAAFVEPDERQMKKQDDVVKHSVFSAGPIANLILALIFGLILFGIFAPISEKMHTNDGIEIVSLNETGPAFNAGIRNNTVITKIDSREINDVSDFVNVFDYCISPGQTVVLSNSTQGFAVVPTEKQNSPGEAYIGVNLKTHQAVNEDAKKYAGVFSWFQDLFMWLFLLNIFIGLANLLPIFITDGAQMLQVLFLRVITNKKTAMKAWTVVNALFLALMIIGLLANYLKPLF